MANKRLVEEITIEVPWGHVAAKWWGPRNVRPIIALHGWQDNAGTFDTLIPLLPAHLSYLAIDFPGHGLSSYLPAGQLYSTVSYFYHLTIILEKFKWPKVSLMGHSMGAMISFLYAATYPDKCDMVISFDRLKPDVTTFHIFEALFQRALFGSEIADRRNRTNEEPPSYSYDELIDKMNSSHLLSVTREVAPILLKRAIRPSAIRPNKFFFSRDGRVRVMDELLLSHDVNLRMAKEIIAPYCYIQATNDNYRESHKYFAEMVPAMLENNDNFEAHSVAGDHHVHLTDPHKVSNIVAKFINKIRPPVAKL